VVEPPLHLRPRQGLIAKHDATDAQDDPVGLCHLDPQPGRLLVESRCWHGQVLDRKTVLGGLVVEDGEGFLAIVVIGVDS
jgi:hypothetical protein